MTLPGGNAAGEVVNLLKSLAGEYLSSGPAAAAGSSVSDNRFFGIQFIQSVIQRRQGHQLAAGDPGGLVFLGLTNIKQGKTTLFIRIHEGLQLPGTHIVNRGEKIFQAHEIDSFRWSTIALQLWILIPSRLRLRLLADHGYWVALVTSLDVYLTVFFLQKSGDLHQAQFYEFKNLFTHLHVEIILFDE